MGSSTNKSNRQQHNKYLSGGTQDYQQIKKPAKGTVYVLQSATS